MEIKNEAHARQMIREWAELPGAAAQRQISLAIQGLELNAMYYEQKGNESGVARVGRCLALLRAHLADLEP